MGCDESKFCAAKHKRAASKKCINKLLKLGLRPEEADHMFKLLKEQRFVPISVIRDAWTDLLTQELMDVYERYLVTHSDTAKNNVGGEDAVDISTFSLFLSNFVKGIVEDRIDLYGEFMRMKDESFLLERIIEYSVELMKSVFLTMAKKNVTQYAQWLERGSEFTDDTIGRWTLATICNVCDPDEISSLSLNQMNSWITLNTDVTWLQCYLFYSLYEMEKLETHKSGEQKGVQCPLPFLEFDSAPDDWKAIIDIPSVVFLNSHLPTENRYQWRLAYSVDIHGEGFTTLRSLICNRGPTVLVIKDKDDHVFGGYASTSWHVGPQFFGDQRCFLFSLRPVMKIHPTLPHNDHFLYLNANQKALPNGLGMGGQLEYWGLWIDASFEFGSCSPSCSTYAGYKMLSGSQTFEIAGLEVWSAEGNLTDIEDGSVYNTVNDHLRKDQEEASILDKDPGARALMDMLGKTHTGRDFLDTSNAT